MGCCSSQSVGDNAYMPSSFTLTMAMPQVTEYRKGYNGRDAATPKYTGNKKILVVGTEERFLEMKNSKLFDTGNHPIETLVPLLYLRDAGFKFDFATPTGKPVHFEMWAFPNKDENVKTIFNDLKFQMDSPLKLTEINENLDEYIAMFIPGGHGAMHLANNEALGKLLRSAHSQEMTTISLCHGPAALLSAAVGVELASTGAAEEGSNEFIYKGYKICVFPDSVDDFTPKIGYMPGLMKVPVCGALLEKGIEIMNKADDDSTYIHKELITGASPKASNNLGKVASDELVKKLC